MRNIILIAFQFFEFSHSLDPEWIFDRTGALGDSLQMTSHLR
jgi:hypothetical protein